MIITFENYKLILPEKLHSQFKIMAGRGSAIIYKDQVLRYVNIDE